MGEISNAYKIWVGKPEVRDYSKDQGIDGRMILKFMF
jgi:hypothetical protein